MNTKRPNSVTQLARDMLSTPESYLLISTVNIFTSGPNAYETMVFRCDERGRVTDWMELDVRRYATRSDAMDGHVVMVNSLGVPLDG